MKVITGKAKSKIVLFSQVSSGSVFRYANSQTPYSSYLKVGDRGCIGTNAVTLKTGKKCKVLSDAEVIILFKAEVYLNEED